MQKKTRTDAAFVATDSDKLSVLQGLAAQIRSPQCVAQVKRDYNNSPYLDIASVTPVQPFAYSVSTANFPFTFVGKIVQEAR